MLGFEKVKPSSEHKAKYGREPISDDTKVKIVELYNSDHSLRQIANACGVSKSFVSHFIRRMREEQSSNA